MWKIYLIKQSEEKYEGSDQFNSPEDAMNAINEFYSEYEGAYWDDDLQLRYDPYPNIDNESWYVLGYIENVKEDYPEVQHLLFDMIEEPDVIGRFGLFSDIELWLLYNVLNTTTGMANSSSGKLIHEIMWEQKMRYKNISKE